MRFRLNESVVEDAIDWISVTGPDNGSGRSPPGSGAFTFTPRSRLTPPRRMPLTRTVDVHVAGLRQKIERNPEFIVTVHGLGYKFLG